jgi:peptidyl-prolyl cis-trans isomerase C
MSCSSYGLVFFIVGICVGSAAGVVVREETAQTPPRVVDDLARPLAVVGGVAITVMEVDAVLKQRSVLRSELQSTDSQAEKAARLAVLEMLVHRQLAMSRLLELGGEALRARIVRAQQAASAERVRVGENTPVPEERLKNIAWSVAWGEYLRSQLTEENLRRYYEKNHWRYGDSRANVSQIMILHPTESAAEKPEDLLRQVKEAIDAGTIDFATAARQHSQSPSAENGGALGWIEPQGDVPKAVAVAVFEGELNRVLGPIASDRGWHLVWVHERHIPAGVFEKVSDRATLQRDVTDFLFNRLVDQARASVSVVYPAVDETIPSAPK